VSNLGGINLLFGEAAW